MYGGLDYDRICWTCGEMFDSRDAYRAHRRHTDCFGKRARLEYDANLNVVPKTKQGPK